MFNDNDIHSAKAVSEKFDLLNAQNQRERALEEQQYIQTKNLQTQNEKLSSLQISIENMNRQLINNGKESNKQFIAIITVAILTLIATIISIFR